MAKKSVQAKELDKWGYKFVTEWSWSFNFNDDGCCDCVVQLGRILSADKSKHEWHLIGMMPSNMQICFIIHRVPQLKEGVSWSLVNRYIQSSRGLKVYYNDEEVSNDLVGGAREFVDKVKKLINELCKQD